MADMTLIKKFADTLKETGRGTEPYDTPAEVVRIEGNTAWVHIPGGVDETPVQLTVNAEEGDIVQVRVGGGSAWITGNATAPPTDDKVAVAAQATAEEALRAAGYYVSSDETGVMIADMKEGGRETPSTATKKNIRIDEDSVDVRDGQTVLTSFGETSVIGKDTGSRLVIDNNSLEMVGPGTEGSYAFIGDLRGSDGRADISEGFIGDGDETQFQVSFNVASVTSVKINNTATTAYTRSGRTFTFNSAPAAAADIEINYRTASANAKAYTLGRRGNGEIGGMSVVENSDCIATAHYSHAEGLATEARGKKSHAEGEGTMASGEASHAEGFLGRAGGKYSHVGGYGGTAIGTGSFAHGRAAQAVGDYSAAFGYFTEARGANQFVVGANNKPDTANKYAFIVGNGSNSKSNAFAVGWDGSIEAALFRTKDYTYTYSNMAAGTTILVTGTDLGVSTPSGYTPIGFVTCHSGLRYVDVIWQDATATGSSNVIVLYNHSTSVRSGTAKVTILYARTGIIS